MTILGSESKFLDYNRDNIFISLVQAEGHFRNLESGAAGRGEFMSCISKHLAYAEGEAEEAVSHSLIVEGSERSRDYATIREEARTLRKRIQGGGVTAEEGIREIRRIRSLFERVNPHFDTGKCRSCGNAEGFLEELGAENDKGLYSPSAQHSHRSNESDQNMKAVMKEVATVVGGVNIGWGIGYTAKAYLDPMAPGAIMGQTPSLLIDVGGTLAGIIGAVKLKGATAKKLATYIAAGLSTYIWDDLAKLLAPAPVAVRSYANANAKGYPTVGVGAVGTAIPAVPGYPYPAQRLAEYPFASPVSVGATMSPPHYTLNGVSGLKNVVLGPKYTLDGM